MTSRDKFDYNANIFVHSATEKVRHTVYKGSIILKIYLIIIVQIN